MCIRPVPPIYYVPLLRPYLAQIILRTLLCRHWARVNDFLFLWLCCSWSCCLQGGINMYIGHGQKTRLIWIPFHFWFSFLVPPFVLFSPPLFYFSATGWLVMRGRSNLLSVLPFFVVFFIFVFAMTMSRVYKGNVDGRYGIGTSTRFGVDPPLT